MIAISVTGVIRADAVGASRLITRVTTGAESRQMRAKVRAIIAGLFNKRTSADSPSSADNASQVSMNIGIARDPIAVMIWPISRRLGRSIADADAVAVSNNPAIDEGL